MRNLVIELLQPHKGGLGGNKEISGSPPVTTNPASIPSQTSPYVSPPPYSLSTSPRPTTPAPFLAKPAESHASITSPVASANEANSKSTDETPDVNVRSTPDIKKRSHLLLSKDEYQEHHSAIIQGR